MDTWHRGGRPQGARRAGHLDDHSGRRPAGDLTRAAGLHGRSAVVVVMWLLLLSFLIGLATGDRGFDVVVDGWLGSLTHWVAAAVCWLAVRGSGPRRAEVLLTATAVTAFSAGNSYVITMLAADVELSFPSAADVGYLAFYPLMLAALTLVVRRELRDQVTSVRWDAAVGSLAAAAVLAVVMRPIIDDAVGPAVSLASVVAVAYPMFGLLIVAAIVGTLTLQGLRVSRRWAWLLAGLIVIAAADVSYALRVFGGGYVIGTPLDAGWAIAMTCVAAWVVDARHPRAPPGVSTASWAPLVMPAVATALGLGVLVLAPRTGIVDLPVALATATLLVAAGRTQIAFRDLMRMADLRIQASTDDLTGLSNRRALYRDVSRRLGDHPDAPHALLLLDLDKFKEVNDSLGHHVGDRLLVEVGARLREQLRPADVLARLGGDEFAILLPRADRNMALSVAGKLRAALAASFTLEGIELHTQVSIGIALFPEHGQDLSVLLRRADIAMYKAKTGRVGYGVSTSADDADGKQKLWMMQELRGALATGQLVLHYQPKLDLPQGTVGGVEALVRWDHPSRGLLYPGSFLGLVEDAGLMPELTQTVLRTALDQVAAWQAQGRDLTVAVNLSASSLVDASLPGQIAGLLAARALASRVLQLEITEGILMADRDRARAIMARLRALGIQIAVDDFGTGYSSLAYLRDLPIDELKLDRSFVFPMADDARAAALVAATIAMAHSLGLRMVAEGVETDVALRELARHGCDQAQGYFMCRPVAAVELEHWLDTRSTTRVA